MSIPTQPAMIPQVLFNAAEQNTTFDLELQDSAFIRFPKVHRFRELDITHTLPFVIIRKIAFNLLACKTK